ncbi:MAG: hypothetical protein SFY69_08955 [Planctomycetota bacterium]|nr:hypothetical protein [Planctomycetota bacterium]
MSGATCPTCRVCIDVSDVNIAEGVGLCRGCGKVFRLSRLVEASEGESLREAAVGEPPEGCWATDDGVEIVVGASTRSVGGAIGTLAVSLFWNGIVSVFVLLAISGTIKAAGFTPPGWFPAPMMNGSGMGLGMTIFLWIFLTPFIVIGLAMLGAFVMSLGGRVEVRVRDAAGELFTGIGPVGWTRRFHAAGVTRVAVEHRRWKDSDGDARSKQEIVVEADRTLRFGSYLPDERRTFVAGKLADVLVAA